MMSPKLQQHTTKFKAIIIWPIIHPSNYEEAKTWFIDITLIVNETMALILNKKENYKDLTQNQSFLRVIFCRNTVEKQEMRQDTTNMRIEGKSPLQAKQLAEKNNISMKNRRYSQVLLLKYQQKQSMPSLASLQWKLNETTIMAISMQLTTQPRIVLPNIRLVMV